LVLKNAQQGVFYLNNNRVKNSPAWHKGLRLCPSPPVRLELSDI
jgi:hypothetical protein